MSIKSKFVRSSGWMLLGTGSDYVIQFVIFVVLARILAVSEVGVVALAIVVIEVGRVVVNSGYGEVIVRRETFDEHVASVCFTINLALGVALALAMATLGSFAFEHFYQAGSGAPVAALSAIFVLEASRAVHSAKLRREFKYRDIAARGTVASLLSGAGAILLALNGWGVWSLVLQRLVYQAVMNGVTWWSARWTPSLVLDRAVMRELAPFTLRVTISRTLDLLGSRVPDLVVGALFGPVGVGYYRVGARGIDAINRLAIQPFQDAAFAAFSRVGEARAIGHAYLRVTRTAAILMFPLQIGAAAIAPEIVFLVFGAKYAESGPVFSALALGAMPSTIVYFTLAAYLAAGHPKAMLQASGVALASNLGFVLGSAYGLLGAAIGLAVTQYLLAAQNLHLLNRFLGLSPRKVCADLAAPLIAAGLMGISVYALKRHALAHLDVFPRTAIVVAAGAAIYAVLMLLGGRRHLMRILADVAPLLPRAVASRIPQPKAAE